MENVVASFLYMSFIPTEIDLISTRRSRENTIQRIERFTNLFPANSYFLLIKFLSNLINSYLKLIVESLREVAAL